MIFIENLELSIEARSLVTGKESKFGFSHNFKLGLNIISGKNTSGKSTILSCIYYCLGVEQLLGDKNNKALDKSVKEKFKIKNEEFEVIYSEASLVINNGSKVSKLTRKIKPSNNIDQSKIFIYDGTEYVKFIHSSGDTLRENGFFYWLENFSGIKLPTVYSYDNKETKLYFQNIFSGIFIEQKRGWSDYFATTPSFSIKHLKQKIIEFFLDLNSLYFDLKYEQFKYERQELKNYWEKIVKNIYNICFNNSISFRGLDNNPKSKSEINKDFKIYFKNESNNLLTREQYELFIKSSLDSLNKSLEINLDPINNLEHLLYDKKKTENEISQIRLNLDNINLRCVEEKEKINSYKNQLKSITNEINNIRDLKKIKSNNLIMPQNIDKCPLCHNNITEIIAKELEPELNNDLIDSSINHLENQSDLYKGYIKSSLLVEEKLNSYKNYYFEILNNKYFILQKINESLNKDYRSPKKEIISEIVLLEQKLNKIDLIYSELNKYIEELGEVYGKYFDVNKKIKNLEKDLTDDEKKLLLLSNRFKDYLNKFGYSSQKINDILIKTEDPNKFLPTVSKESLRVTSSASDFIRVLWAFYLSILDLSDMNHHPGITIFDEPGQHAMMEESLKEFIKVCSTKKDKQIILAISKNRKGESYSLSDILKELEEETFNHIKLSDEFQSIGKIN